MSPVSVIRSKTWFVVVSRIRICAGRGGVAVVLRHNVAYRRWPSGENVIPPNRRGSTLILAVVVKVSGSRTYILLVAAWAAR
jgi:hypothetical protein